MTGDANATNDPVDGDAADPMHEDDNADGDSCDIPSVTIDNGCDDPL